MSEKIKFNGGPKHGKYYNTNGSQYEILIEDVKVGRGILDYRADTSDFAIPMTTRRGSYRPSNRVLKDGTRVWQWMGWYS